MQAFITKGCSTDHGGQILEGDDSWIVEGKGVHLEGMTHYCPKCKVMSKAIATERGFLLVNGRNMIVAGDKSTCGAKYIKISDLAVRDRGTGTSSTSYSSSSQSVNKVKKYSGQYQLINEVDGTSYKNVKYIISYKDGRKVEGVTDENGMTGKLESTESAENIEIKLFEADSW